MQIVKIYKREDGSRVKLRLGLFIDFSRVIWTPEVSVCAPKKRTFVPVVQDTYDYRRMSHEEKKEFELKQALVFLTTDELKSAVSEYLNEINIYKDL